MLLVKDKNGRYLQVNGKPRRVTKRYFEKYLSHQGYTSEEEPPKKKLRKKKEVGEPLENANGGTKHDA